MKHLQFPALALLAIVLVPATASAAVFSTVGDSVHVDYNGIVEGEEILGLTASTEYNLVAIEDGGSLWRFTGSLTNTSGVDSRVSIAGFDTSGMIDLGSSSASGDFSKVSGGNMPQGFDADFCLKNTGGNNCAGGGGAGAWNAGDTLEFMFTIQLLEAVTELEINDYSIRYQSIVGVADGSSGVGGAIDIDFTPGDRPPEIPIPAAGWLMLSALAGLGAVKARK